MLDHEDEGQFPRLLERIGISRPVAPTAEALMSLHEAFSLAIPYENISIQLAERNSLDARTALPRLSSGRRGGWCYDLNGAFGLLLAECGFQVRRVTGAGSRETLGDFWIGSHLVLLVDLPEGPWLADVGYGDGPVRAVPLVEHEFQSAFFKCSLSKLGDGWWRYQNDPRASAPSFDFREDDALSGELARMHDWLSTSEESPYIQNLVVQRWSNDCHATLRGKVLTILTPSDKQKQTLPSREAWLAVLRSQFDIELGPDDAARLWQKVEHRHSRLAVAT